MPAVVWADMRGISERVTDKELLDFLKDMNRHEENRWELEEREVVIQCGWFRKSITKKVYTLYWDCRGEWQAMNMFGGFSISRERMANYMLGYLCGFESRAKLSA